MIIRRKHTANFTTIGNALFDDERLAADEVGILAYLLRQHHDWEVRRPALMRRWNIGPVSMKRIINNWMRFGWCQAKKTRLSNGTFSIVYEIKDQPGPDLSEDEIRDALSLVSSEASDDESAGSERPDQPHATEHPPPCQRGVADHGVVGEGVASKKKLLNTDSSKTDSTNGGRAFAEVQGRWPSDKIVSPFACEQLHAALSETLQEDAFNGVRPYLSECESEKRKICDLATFYKERRWEKFQKIRPAPGAPRPTIVKPGTPQWFRWRDYKIATGQSIKLMDDWSRQGREMTMPSEWPPAMPKTEEAKSASHSASSAA